MGDARHLSMYIFPREYGFATAFASVRAHKYADFADREDEIKVRVECVSLYVYHLICYIKKAGMSKTPKRVKSTLDFLEKIIYRHGTCSYNALRDIACPSKLKRPEQETALDASIILVCLFMTVVELWCMHVTVVQELLSEESIHLSTQQSISTHNTSLEPSPSTGGSKCKPRFAEFACSSAEVIN